jgi:hypothetical protein
MRFKGSGIHSALLATVVSGALAPLLWAQPNEISFAGKYPIEALRPTLTPRDEWRPFPILQDRHGWDVLGTELKREIIRLGEEALRKEPPPLPASLYLEFARNGNRSRFEAVYFERRVGLHRLVTAECVENKGRFLDAIANALWALCEESSWCIPAHVGAQKTGIGLPDLNEPIVDLFAAQTASNLSWTLYLLGDALDKVSPRIRPRVLAEIDRRILTPFETRDDFGWMGFSGSGRDRPNNWNPWINASVMTASLASESDENRRIRLVHKTLRSLDRFVQPYPSDGGCDEGPGYWGRAAASLFESLELLHGATRGRFDEFASPLIGEMGRFIYRVHITDDYYVPVGDCSARLHPEAALVRKYGQRIADPRMESFGRWLASRESVRDGLDGQDLGRMLLAIFPGSVPPSAGAPTPPLVRDVWLPSEDMQLMAARDSEGSAQGLYLAAWGAHNAQSHNHNDVGNFVVFVDGQPALVDVGAPTYTAQTFSRRRYELWPMQSAWHNLPTINGVMQDAGRKFAARNVRYSTDAKQASLTMDIAAAYPETAAVKSWHRTVRLNRGTAVELVESFELGAATGPTTLSLMTPLDADASVPGTVSLKKAGAAGQDGVLARISYDPAHMEVSAEQRTLDDTRLSRVWGPRLSRLLVRARKPALKDSWSLMIAR